MTYKINNQDEAERLRDRIIILGNGYEADVLDVNESGIYAEYCGSATQLYFPVVIRGVLSDPQEIKEAV